MVLILYQPNRRTCVTRHDVLFSPTLAIHAEGDVISPDTILRSPLEVKVVPQWGDGEGALSCPRPNDGETCQSEGTCLHEPGTGQHLALLELHSVLIPWKNHLKCGSGEPSETIRVSVLGSWKPRLNSTGPTGSTNGFSVEMLGANHLDFKVRHNTDQQHLTHTLFCSGFESAVTAGNYSKWMNEWMDEWQNGWKDVRTGG